MAEYLIEIAELTKVYGMGDVAVHALRGVNLQVNAGEFVAIMGPSGSGKSTLMNILGCLDRPTDGHYVLDGEDVSRLSRNERADIRRQKLGFIFQFFALIPTLTAYENVEMPLLLTGNGTADRQARVNELLSSVGLADRADHRPDQLSGGEQQRVAVARALATRPSLILADEPTANLDTANGEAVMQTMSRLNQETGVTFVFATHDPRVVKFARRVVTLQDGVVVDHNAQVKKG